MNSNWHKFREQIKDIVSRACDYSKVCYGNNVKDTAIFEVHSTFDNFISDPTHKCDHKKELEEAKIEISNWKQKYVEVLKEIQGLKEEREKEKEMLRVSMRKRDALENASNNQTKRIAELEEELKNCKWCRDVYKRQRDAHWETNNNLKNELELVRKDKQNLLLRYQAIEQELEHIKTGWAPVSLFCPYCNDVRKENEKLKGEVEALIKDRDSIRETFMNLREENGRLFNKLDRIHRVLKGAENV